MSRFSGPILFLLSLILALVLFFGFPHSVSREFFPDGGYAALALDEGVADRETALALEGVLGRGVVSESSQWVFLNSFGSLERIPLDEYDERLESFDPRRDSYAAELRNFFVREGKRWFFIPLDREMFGPLPVLNLEQRLKKRIAPVTEAVYGTASGSVALLLRGEGRPLGFRMLPFVLAWPAALVLAFRGDRGGRRKGPGPGGSKPAADSIPAGFRLAGGPGPGGSKLAADSKPAGFRPAGGPKLVSGFRLADQAGALILLAPPLFVISLWGAPGCALLALALYLGALLTPPLREIRILILRGGEGRQNTGLALGLYRSNLLRALCLAPLSVLIPLAGRIPLVPAFLGLGGIFIIYFLYLGFRVRRFVPEDRRACRFVPLPILPPRNSGRTSGRLRPCAPFALASCLALALSLVGLPSPEPWPFLVEAQDYADHLFYQTGFSRRSLHNSGASGFAPSGYFRYTIGEDGLVAGVLPGNSETESGPEFGLEAGQDGGETAIPPFPLASLSDFLAGWADPRVSGGGAAVVVPPLLALVLVFVPPGGGRKKNPVYDDKRIAA